MSKFKVLICIKSESFIPTIPFNAAPVCANVNFQVKFSLPSPLLRLPQDESLSQFLSHGATRIILLHPGRGTRQPQGYPQRTATATAGESRVFVGLEGNLILVGNWSTLAYFRLDEREAMGFLIHPVQNEKIDGLEHQNMGNLGNAVPCNAKFVRIPCNRNLTVTEILVPVSAPVMLRGPFVVIVSNSK